MFHDLEQLEFRDSPSGTNFRQWEWGWSEGWSGAMWLLVVYLSQGLVGTRRCYSWGVRPDGLKLTGSKSSIHGHGSGRWWVTVHSVVMPLLDLLVLHPWAVEKEMVSWEPEIVAVRHPFICSGSKDLELTCLAADRVSP